MSRRTKLSSVCAVILALTLGVFGAAASASAETGIRITESDSGSLRVSIRGGDRRLEWVEDRGGHRLKAKVHGKIVFTADDRAVASLSSRGSFVLEEARVSNPRRVRIVADRNGELERTFYVDGDRQAWGSAADRWLAEVLPTFIRESAIGSEERVARILAESGADGVLDEIALISGDYSHRRYLSHLVESTRLTPAQQVRALGGAERDLDSDYEVAELLSKSDWISFEDAAVRRAFLGAAASIESDYETRKALSPLLDRRDLDPETGREALALVSRMGSDYEKARLLTQVSPDLLRDDAVADGYMEAVASIDSGYEHRQALGGLLADRQLTAEQLAVVLQSAREISSDYEKASLLVQVAETQQLGDGAVAAYVAVVETVASSYERSRALGALMEVGELNGEALAGLVSAAGGIDSDYERASVLAHTAKSYRVRGEAADAYLKAVSKIDSDYEAQRALKPLIERGALSKEQILRLLDLVSEISSGHHRGRLLSEIAAWVGDDSELRDAYMVAAESLGSDHDYRRAVRALGG